MTRGVPIPPETVREMQRWRVAGYTIQQIADAYHVGLSTVERLTSAPAIIRIAEPLLGPEDEDSLPIPAPKLPVYESAFIRPPSKARLMAGR